MSNRRFSEKLTLVGACGCLLLAIFGPSFVRAQSSATEDWEKAAGGKMSFEVASVKQDKTGLGPGGTHPGSNVPFGAGNMFKPTGGLFRVTNIPLTTFIGFAYKLNGSQMLVLATQVSRSKDMQWVVGYRWDIEARASGDPTKDQYRLMMQSLLADRFKLAAHMGTMQAHIYLIELDKPGSLGPQLKADSVPCSDNPAAAKETPTQPRVPCGGMIFTHPSPGRNRFVGRGVTMDAITHMLGNNADEQRPAVDRTGLSGTFDFTLEWAPHFNGPLPPGYPEPDPTAPMFLEALKDQLGLKLDPTMGPIDVFVIDHIEEPSPN